MNLKSMVKKTLLFLKTHADTIDDENPDNYVTSFNDDGSSELVYSPVSTGFNKDQDPDLFEILGKICKKTSEQNDEENAQTGELSSQNSSDFT